MAKITRADVEYVAGLAQLTLDDATVDRLTGELGQIIEYVDQLSELDTDGIEPMMPSRSKRSRSSAPSPSSSSSTAALCSPTVGAGHTSAPRCPSNR